MSARFKCSQCLNEFIVSEDMGSQSCPFCGSFEVTEKSGGLKVNASGLKKLLLPGSILLLIIVVLIVWPKCKGPVVTKVEIDKVNLRIKVTAEPCPKTKLQYSFDNGKTYQNSSSYKVREPGTFTIVAKDNKNRKGAYGIPAVFSKEDFKKDPPPVFITKPPQIVDVDTMPETGLNRNDGQIKVHTQYGAKRLKYSINSGQSWSSDSVFNNLTPGNYSVKVADSLTREDTWIDNVVIIRFTTPPPPFCKPTKTEVETTLNDLFNDPDNQTYMDSINVWFLSQTMTVDCELIGIPPNTPYQLFQFLQRRYDGKPGSKRIEVQSIGYDNRNKINRIIVKEIPVSNNN